MAPSKLAVATSSLNRLVKEYRSYEKERDQQKARITKITEEPSDDQNAEFILKQEKQVLKETEAIFPHLDERIDATLAQVRSLVPNEQEYSAEEIEQAREALTNAISFRTGV